MKDVVTQEYRVEHPWLGLVWVRGGSPMEAVHAAAKEWGVPWPKVARECTVIREEHRGFTPQELEEMARADREIEEAFLEGCPQEEAEHVPVRRDLNRVARLARAHQMSYGTFVAQHSEEELEEMLREENRKE